MIKKRIPTNSILMTYKWLLIIIALMNSHLLSAQNPEKYLRVGNKLYNDSLYSEAESKYTKALEVDPNYNKGLYNQGNALYQQKKYEEAEKNFELSADLMDSPSTKAAAYHNLGNTLFDKKEYEKSIDAYKNALRNNPNDMDTKYNLLLAKKMLEQQQQQNKDQENKDQQNKDQQNKDQQDKDQQNQDDQKKEGQNDQKDQKDQNKQDEQGKGDQSESDKQSEDQPAPKLSKLSPEEVKRIIEALANDEKQTVKNIMLKDQKTKSNKSDKDW